MQQDDIEKYCALMEEIKRRMVAINAFGAEKGVTPFRATTIECVYLQLRKILELIAFGSLIANRKQFSAVYHDFAQYRNARKFLGDIEKLNPDFYPHPIVETPSGRPGVKMESVDKRDGFLTKAEFLKLYEKCGAIMHAANPFGSQVDYGYYEQNVQVWIDKIIGLLNCHTIRLSGDPNMYLIHMKEAPDNRVRGYIFTPVPKTPGDEGHRL